MALSRVVSEIGQFNVEKYRDLDIRVKGRRSLMTFLFDHHQTLMTQSHRNRHVSIRHLGFPLTFRSNQWPIWHRFRDRRRFQS